MKKFLCIILIFISDHAIAQYNVTIRSARPGQAFGPFTTGKKIFQIQTGVNFNQFKVSDMTTDGTGFNYLMSLRYGITETIEVRSAFKINYDKSTTQGEEIKASGLSAMVVGIRFNILDNAGTYKPSLGFQANINLNVLSDDFNPGYPLPAMLLLHNQKLADWLIMTTNWGIFWSGDEVAAKGLYTINLSFPISKRVGGFIENYGFLSNRNIDTFFDTGVDYLITNDLLVDLSIGYSKNNGIDEYFIDFGVSWRTGL